MDNEIKTTLVVETDNASVAKAKKAVQSISDDLDEQIRLQEEFAKKAKQVASEADKAYSEMEKRNRSSRQNFESSVDKLTSSAGGLGKLQSGIGALSDLSDGLDVGGIIGAVDGIANLTEGISGLPSLLGNVGSAAGIAGIALAGVATAFALVQAEAQKNAELIGARIDAFTEANLFEAQGGTLEGATAIADEAKALRDATQATLDTIRASYEQSLDELGLLEGVARLISPEEEKIAQKIGELEATLRDAQTRYDTFTELINKGTLATEQANDELSNLPPALDGVTQSANEAREQERALADERRKSEQVAEEARKAEEARAKAIQDLNNKLVEVAQKRADSEQDLATQLSDNTSDARRKLNNDLKSLDKKARDETVKAVQNFQNDEAKLARDHARNLEKIITDSNRQREELERNLDFGGLFDLESDTNQALSDAQAQFEVERDERQIAFDNQFRDLKLSLADERAVRNQAFKDELGDIQRNADRARRDKNIAFEREIRDATLAYERMYGTTKQGLDRINAEFERQFGRGAVATSGNGQPLPNVPMPSRGGIGFAPVSNNSIISRNEARNYNAGGVNINISGVGMNNPADVERAVLNGIKKVFG